MKSKRITPAVNQVRMSISDPFKPCRNPVRRQISAQTQRVPTRTSREAKFRDSQRTYFEFQAMRSKAARLPQLGKMDRTPDGPLKSKGRAASSGLDFPSIQGPGNRTPGRHYRITASRKSDTLHIASCLISVAICTKREGSPNCGMSNDPRARSLEITLALRCSAMACNMRRNTIAVAVRKFSKATVLPKGVSRQFGRFANEYSLD
jgi:hypothetical protein